MAIIAKKPEGEETFEPIPEGVHLAVCYGIVDLGTHYSEKYDKKYRKIRIFWEIPEETFEKDGKEIPRFISKEYTNSLGDKSNLTKDLQAWRGKKFTEEELAGFDLENIINKGCQLQVIHSDDKKHANIAAIMAMPKGIKAPKPINENVYFDLDSGDSIEVIDELMLALPEWIQNKIKESETYLALKYNKDDECENINADDLIGEDEIPF